MNQIVPISSPMYFPTLEEAKQRLSELPEDQLKRQVRRWLTTINSLVRKSETLSREELEMKIAAYSFALKSYPVCCWETHVLEDFCSDIKFFPAVGDISDFFQKYIEMAERRKRIAEHDNRVRIECRRSRERIEENIRDLTEVQLSKEDDALLLSLRNGEISKKEFISDVLRRFNKDIGEE